ncbi:MAG: SusC/RagA family TonB-linked outer membrane protein [Parabacteroides distasonis]
MQIKIYISFLITALFLCVPHTRAQEIEVPITLNEHGTQLRDVLRKIEQQSPYLFLYNETQLDMKQKINEKITSPDIRKILDRLCGPIGIRYEIMDVQILLMPKIDTGKPKPYPVPVTGYITDEKGSPMEFVSVIDLLSGKGGLTNEEGYFRFFTDKDSCRLQISHLAYKPELRTVGPDNRHLQIQLIPAVFNLDEVVAIGYGTLARKELTSAVGYVSSERFLSGKVNNPIQGIKGLIAGMSISGSSLSDINSIPDIQIRGAGSILAGNKPLVVVDGVPGVSLNSLSLAEIASISVLKDGSSAAIYGSNGANGVILITTKSGKSSDKLQANYQTYLAAAHEYNRPRVLSPEAFVAAGRDADLGYHTDWQAALIRSCPLEQNHDLSIQNGWKSGAFRISMNYRDGQGLDIVSSRREYALRTHISQNLLSGYLELTVSLAYKKQHLRLGNHTAFQQAMLANPTAPIYTDEEETEYLYPSGFERDNPVASLKEENRQQENQFMTGSLTARINWSKPFYSTIMLAENREESEENVYWTSRAKESVDNNRKGRADRTSSKYVNRTLDWTNHYDKAWDQHTVKAMIGYSFQRWDHSGMNAGNADFPTDFFTWNNIGTGSYLTDGKATLSSFKNSSKLISVFARFNYSYRDLLMLSASFRREGSSKFGANHKWGNFPAFSGGIRLSELPAFQTEWLDDLKFRVGYGVSGRHNFSPYQSLETYAGAGKVMVDGKWIQVFGPSNNPNPDLRWEKSLHTNIGAEAILFNSRLMLSLNLFKRTTKDLLFVYNAIKPPMIHDNITTNVGTIDSKGLEWEMNWLPVRTKNFQYSASLTGSLLSSTLKSLSNNQFKLGYTYLYDLPTPGLPGPAIRLEEGKPIGSFFGWRYAGTDAEGNILVWSKDGRKIPTTERTEEDKNFIGNGVPKVQLSFSHTFTWKNFDLRLFFTSWLGYDLLNLKQMYYGLQNVPVTNLLEDAYTRNDAIKGDKIYCDYFLENGNFLKLEELTLGYKIPLPDNKWIQSLRCYFSVNNVFTLTGYTGGDPANINVNGVEPGIETTSIYPVARTFTLGLSVQF